MRNLIICCDGTGNTFSAAQQRTNVSLFVEAIRKEPAEGRIEQIVYYDPGVGTADDFLAEAGESGPRESLRRVRGLAEGGGVWNNVAQAYDWLADNHREMDRIFLFGFSRGAFTVRALAAVVHNFGLIASQHRNLTPMLIGLYRKYGRDPTLGGRGADAAKDVGRNFLGRDTNVFFMGVWDTVESVGGLSLFGGPRLVSNKEGAHTRHVRHALAIDESRLAFLPSLFEKRKWSDTVPIEPEGQKIVKHDKKLQSTRQVWFAGGHCDIGGSYEESGLSNITLHWMAEEARECGIEFERAVPGQSLEAQDVFTFGQGKHRPNPYALLHDEILAAPFWALTNIIIFLVQSLSRLTYAYGRIRGFRGPISWLFVDKKHPPLKPSGLVNDVRAASIQQSIKNDWARVHPSVFWRADTATCRYALRGAILASATNNAVQVPAALARVTRPSSVSHARTAVGLGRIPGRLGRWFLLTSFFAATLMLIDVTICVAWPYALLSGLATALTATTLASVFLHTHRLHARN